MFDGIRIERLAVGPDVGLQVGVYTEHADDSAERQRRQTSGRRTQEIRSAFDPGRENQNRHDQHGVQVRVAEQLLAERHVHQRRRDEHQRSCQRDKDRLAVPKRDDEDRHSQNQDRYAAECGRPRRRRLHRQRIERA